MKLERIVNKEVVVLDASETLNTAIQQLGRLNIRHLPVTKRGVLIGMVSERDVLLHAFSDVHIGDNQVGESRVDTFMTSPIVALCPDDTVETAARLMLNKQISAIPLSTKNILVGIVTETDFLECFMDDGCPVPGTNCRQHAVTDHMSTNVISIDPDDSTSTAIRLMLDNHMRHVPVVRGSKLFGIVSDRDVLRGGPQDKSRQPTCVSDLRIAQHSEVRGVMSKHLVVLAPSATLADAAQEMVTHKIGAAPVVNCDKLVGIITETDLLGAFVAARE